jgi:Ca-activated chloride channel homolog
MSAMTLRTVGGLALFAMLSGTAPGQDARVTILPREPARRPAAAVNNPSAQIRVNSDLVLIPVTVTDWADRAVLGMGKENFRLYDDTVEQEISHFAMDDAPVSLILVFDASGSMVNKLQKSRSAVNEILRPSNPEDEFMLIEFNDGARVLEPFTHEPQKIQDRLTFMGAHGRTALLDATHLALNEIKNARNPRKAILIISDGGDNCSRYNEHETKRRVREADVQIYSIGIMEPVGKRNASVEETLGPSLLNDIAGATGGRLFEVGNLNELPEIASKISAELRNQYVLGYSPSVPKKDGRYHQIRVRLNPPQGAPKLKATFRSSYLAPER